MKKIIVLISLVLFLGQLCAEEETQISNAELFITKPGRNYLENVEIYKPGKQIQSPYRRLDFMYVKYKDLDNDSVLYGIRLICITDYLTNQNRIYNSILDTDEIDPLIKWIKYAQEKASTLVEYQTISHVSKKGLLMFGIFKENKKVYFRLTNNKYQFSTAIFFDMAVLDDLMTFLEEIKAKN